MEQPTSSSIARLGSGLSRRQRWRLLKDKIAARLVAFGGIGVIIAIILIFFYLLYVVLPLFKGASAEQVSEYQLDMPGQTLHLELEEQAVQAVRYTDTGEAQFFEVKSGEPVRSFPLLEGDEQQVSTLAHGFAGSDLVALGLDDGHALLVKHNFKISYPNNVRTLTPQILYPYGEEYLTLFDDGTPVELLAFADGESRLTFVAEGKGRISLVRFDKEVNFLDESVTLERSSVELEGVDLDVAHILIDPQQERLYLADSEGHLLHYDIRDLDEMRLLERATLIEAGKRMSNLRFLVGGYSLLAATKDGEVVQWFPVRNQNNDFRLQRIRSFKGEGAPITDIATEERRKAFVVADQQGRIAFYHTTAHREVLVEDVGKEPIPHMAISPRADGLLMEQSDGAFRFWHVDNEHPEISWSALWGKVHYEGYEEPRYIWQSSSSSNDFEPKLSLTPLTFGTLKAAFYAMMIAVPLAIMGAIFTAYFMAPEMRKMVKPTIEVMEALPTVILGFLAGLWLAPVIEGYLPGMFAMLLIMPLGILAFTFMWQNLPKPIQHLVPAGWEAALLIPVVLLLGWFSLLLSVPLESVFFDGDIRGWLTEQGISFDQRNSLVVGLAMGFAVIPTIFSITEDAIFSVPKHLTYGSLALGATPWQTLVRVVLLTASPGIFSAVMIGLGRAVGETMIVLMATGNTPVMDFSIFQGMRTLSANIAVEMPESEVDSTHYRVLFLAALTLFMFTFVFNTLAELVRQRLRRKYSSL